MIKNIVLSAFMCLVAAVFAALDLSVGNVIQNIPPSAQSQQLVPALVISHQPVNIHATAIAQKFHHLSHPMLCPPAPRYGAEAGCIEPEKSVVLSSICDLQIALKTQHHDHLGNSMLCDISIDTVKQLLRITSSATDNDSGSIALSRLSMAARSIKTSRYHFAG